MPRAKRIYKKGVRGSEYDQYHGKKEQILRRADRVQARRKAERSGLVRKGDGLEVHHVGSHRIGRLKDVPTRVVTFEYNRSKQPKRS